MKQSSRFAIPAIGLACVGMLLCRPVPVAGGVLPPEDGPVQTYTPPETSRWKDRAASLPAYPQAGRLLELDVDTPGFRTYIDPDSLSAGKDETVRFTTVQISASGVWNVTYEGFHCGAQTFRRFAYGSSGHWREIPGDDWQPLTMYGTGRYRKMLYYGYMCNPAEPDHAPDHILRRLRSRQSNIGD